MKAELSQKGLAEIMEFKPPMINYFEKGSRRPTLLDAFKMESLMDIKDGVISNWIIADDFFRATGQKRPEQEQSKPKISGETKPLNTGVQGEEVAAPKVGESNQKAYSLNNGVERRKIMGEIIPIKVKLPQDIYFKLEFH